LKPDAVTKEDALQLNTKSPQGVHLETVYRTLLRMVAYLEETGYTEDQLDMNLCQVEVFQHPDPADPASDMDTSQG
jgi:hypothetical protein